MPPQFVRISVQLQTMIWTHTQLALSLHLPVSGVVLLPIQN